MQEFEEDAAVEAAVLSPQEIKDRMRDAARSALRLARRLEWADEIGKRLKARRNRIVRQGLPDLMSAFGSASWADEDGGLVLKVAPKAGGSLSQSEDPEAAIRYLAANGFAGAVLTTLTIEFGEDERAKADAIAEMLARTLARPVKVTRGVHHSTLAAWALKRLKDGVPTDLKLIGISAWREATVKES